MERVLIIEDELPMRTALADVLSTEGYRVLSASDGESGLRRALEDKPDLILLDIMMPKLDGFTVCSELRRLGSAAPVLILTAKGFVEDRVAGLDAGADDYLVKPFSTQELLARVRALLRRDWIHKTRIIRIADLEIDTVLRRVVRASQVVSLTNREYTLLEALASREGQALPRGLIQKRVWMDEESYSNTVDVHVRALRKKIDAGCDVKLIHSVYGLGYMVKGPDSEDDP